MSDPIKKARKAWEESTLKKSLSKVPERKKGFATGSGIALERVFTPEDLDGLDYLRDLGFPGAHPFTRGVQPTMYRSRFWTMRQYAGFGTAEESNARYKYLIAHGQTGLSVAFDLPTQIGYDSDNPIARGEVGKVGVAIDSLNDMETLFDGIRLDEVSTSMTINAPAAVLLAMLIAVGERQGVPAEKIRGTTQNDILKEYVARGTYIYPPEASMRLVTDIFEFCSGTMPLWNTISISGYHIREAGSTAVQEVAFTLANAIAYVRAAVERGLDIDAFASRISFFFNSHNRFLEEVSKFRAARRLWARIMKERFHAKKPRSLMLRFHTQTGGSTLTAQQPENNIVRVTIQGLAAVLGGTQSLHTNSMDEALCLPTEKAVRIALRTQQIVAHESGVADTVDPLGGAYAIERLTDEIEKGAEAYIERIDALGGVLSAIESGYVQGEIQKSAYAYQKEVETGDQAIVGVNRFEIEEEARGTLLRVNPETEASQIGRLRSLKEGRDGGAVRRAIENLRKTAEGDGNLMPPILEAVRAYATTGEICDAMREVFGEYRPPVTM